LWCSSRQGQHVMLPHLLAMVGIAVSVVQVCKSVALASASQHSTTQHSTAWKGRVCAGRVKLHSVCALVLLRCCFLQCVCALVLLRCCLLQSGALKPLHSQQAAFFVHTVCAHPCFVHTLCTPILGTQCVCTSICACIQLCLQAMCTYSLPPLQSAGVHLLSL
jgi:hypothetical protein